MEGIDGDRGPAVQGELEQAPRLRQVARDFVIAERALAQKIAHRLLRCGGQQPQPVVEPRLHFLRRLAREGDGEDFRRRAAREQQAHDARHQEPGLAAAGASLDHHAVLGIERGEYERIDFRQLAHGLGSGCNLDAGFRFMVGLRR